MIEHLKAYAQADMLQMKLGLTPAIGWKIAAIIAFAGGIEHHLERAIWRLRGLDPKGIKPDTDAKMISNLIEMMEMEVAKLPAGDIRRVMEIWCSSAQCGFTIRHNIAHGVPLNLGGEELVFMRNPRWEGEIRKREFGDFYADEPTVELVRDAMAALFRLIVRVSFAKDQLVTICDTAALRALGTARSILSEFASQDYNPSYEKY